MRSRMRLLWILGLVAVLAAIGAVFAYYERTRPHLAERNQAERAAQVAGQIRSLSSEEGLTPAPTPPVEKLGPRATIAMAREFLLDYPTASATQVRMPLALAVAALHDPDMALVGSEVEQAAADILTHLGPNRPPTQQDFVRAGFPSQLQWTPALYLTDVDGDGSADVVFVCPGEREQSVCCLFRHTPRGWIRHRIGLGLPVLGLWVFDITPNGPKALLLASLADNSYDPNLFVDVFAWQNGRLNSVLSTRIEHGFQLDHKDVDGDGSQEIRLFGSKGGIRYNEKARQTEIYKWHGSEYVLSKVEDAPARWTGFDRLAEGKRLLAAYQLPEAIQTLLTATRWKSVKRGNYDEFSDYGGRQEAWYYLGLCYALTGNHAGAVAAMNEVKRQGQAGSEILNAWAQKFLAACLHPGDLPQALETIGQVFRSLELALHTSRPSITPRDLLAAAGITPDAYQETDLTGDGTTEGLARFHWQGGSAVVALQRNGQGVPPWTLWVLAYALTDKPPDQFYPQEAEDWFYLPQAPALSLYPVASTVNLSGVRPRAGTMPQVAITYRQGNTQAEGIVAWQGGRFVAVQPVPKPNENLEVELARIETALFERRDYPEVLDQLAAFEGRVRGSSLPTEDKTDLLLEAFYHEALCYRKLGQSRRASVTYAALWRGYPDSDWAKLAKRWLAFTRGRETAPGK
ncbi:MAG TPA: tetratricopeptide repeat protein [Chthonomonadaceae bacterium]|nr:tetratricopeptide repeat protein [Chthonomonadaceae bacterium]